MIPVKLTVQAFGPYVEEQVIDFTLFQEQGLFLISGDTGSGKTTILDAVTYALFGRSSGDIRGDITVMRSDFAREDISTVVDFEFQLRGRYYRFARGVSIYTNRKGAKEVRKTQQAFYMDEAGAYAPFFENATLKRVNDKAEELLGLTYEQFCQVIILPQGQFETLLVADSKEKEAILSTLFNAEKWDSIIEHLTNMVKQQKDEVETLSKSIQHTLSQYACADVDTMQRAMQEKETQLAGLEQRAKETETAEQKEQVKYADALKLEELFVDGEKAVQEVARLSGLRGQHEEIKERIARASNAQKVMPLRNAAGEAYRNCTNREKEAEQAAAELKQWDEKLHTAVAGLHGQLQKLRDERDTLHAAYAGQQQAVRSGQQEQQRVLENYTASMAYELAQQLEPGQPCPVCGSTHHIKKPEKHTDIATKNDVMRAQKQVDAAREELQKLEKQQMRLESEINESEAAISKAPVTAQAKASAQSRAELVRLIEQAAQQKATTQAMLQKARQEHAAAQTQLEEAKQAYQRERDKYGFEDDAQVMQSGRDSEKVEDMQRELDAYTVQCEAAQARLAQLEQKLAGQTRPHLPTVKDMLDAATQARKSADTAFITQKTTLEAMRGAYAQVQKDYAAWEHKGADYAELESFMKQLRGDKGVSVKRYVLGVMLSSVIHEANQMLRHVQGGRYQLFRPVEEARSHKVGLDLEVADAYTGERRGVAGLSGGEKFLVSLALSLGLSAVVQAQNGGIRMDAMFVDEGFGSLDPQAINDALALLASVRGTSRVVGIISHVGILRESVGATIEVEKQRNGSTIHVRV